MADATQVISFKAEVAPELDQGRLSEIKQEMESGLKNIKVPVDPSVDKGAVQKVAKTINDYIGKTGMTKFKFQFDSSELRELQKALKNIKGQQQEIQKLQQGSSNTDAKKELEKHLMSESASRTSLLKTKGHESDPGNALMTAASGSYDSMIQRSQDAISRNDFKKNVMAAQVAFEEINDYVGKIGEITKTSDWKNNDDNVREVADYMNQIDSRKNFINNLATSKNVVGSSKLNELFEKFEIKPDASLGSFGEDFNKEISSMLTSMVSKNQTKIKDYRKQIDSLMDSFYKNWDGALAEQGISVNGHDVSNPYAVKDDEIVTAQKYNGVKKTAQGLLDKASKGEKLSDSDLLKAEYINKILEKGVTDKDSNVKAPSEDLTNFLKQAVGGENLLKEYNTPSKEKLTKSDFMGTKGWLTKFMEKASGQSQIYLEEAQDMQKALSTIGQWYSQSGASSSNKELDVIANARKWASENANLIKNLPSKSTINKDTVSNISETGKVGNLGANVNTEQLEQALAKVDAKIAELDGKTVTLTINANDENLASVEEKINSIRSIEGNPIDIHFNANVDSINTALQDINELRSKDNIDVAVNFKGSTDDIEKALTSMKEMKERSKTSDGQIDLKVDDSQLEKAEATLITFREKAQTPIDIKLNSNGILDDLVAVESIINDLKKNLDLKIKFNTGQSFSDKKATDIETMINKIATLADKSGTYSAKIASSFAAVGSSVREVTRLVDQLNTKFNLTGEIGAGLKSMNKILAGGKIGTGEKAEVSNPKSNKAKNMADRALSKSIANVDLNQYTTDFANKVEATVNKVKDLKDKHDRGIFFSDDEIEKDYDLLSKLNAELTEFGRNRNKFKLQNNQGTVVGEGIDLADFNEAKAAELFKTAGINSNILETSMGKNGMSAYIKARSREDGKLEKYALNYNQDTGLVRSQLKSRSEYKSLFGQVVGDIGQEVTKLSKYLVSMGGIDVVWQGFQQGVESIKEMDTAMTELKKVTSDTSDVYATVEKDMYSTGKEIGRDAVELTKSTADWARLGYDTKDAEKMSKWTGILMNVSEFEQVDDATNALISIMQGFDKSANDVENVVDVLNNIGNLEPISSDEIASSLQRSASALKAGGNTYEQAVALTTVGNSVVQNPESVGAGLRTIGLRLRATDAKTLQEAGEDTDGVVSSVPQLRQLIQDLTKVSSNDFKGFDILKDDGSFKSTYEILLSISKIWDEIGNSDQGDLKQASLLEKIAGKNRANIAASILQNPTMLEKVYNETQNSEGSALRENETQLDSIQGKVDQLTASFQEMWNSAISSDFIKGLVDAGTSITNLVTKVGLLKTALAGAFGVAGTQGKLGRANYQLSSCTMPRAI